MQQTGEMGKVGVELGLPSILCPAGSEVSEPNISFLLSVANPGTGGSGEEELLCSPVGGSGDAGAEEAEGVSGSGDGNTPLLCE